MTLSEMQNHDLVHLTDILGALRSGDIDDEDRNIPAPRPLQHLSSTLDRSCCQGQPGCDDLVTTMHPNYGKLRFIRFNYSMKGNIEGLRRLPNHSGSGLHDGIGL